MHAFKPTLQLLVRPLARWVAARGGTANQVTMLAMLGSIAVGALLGAIGAWVPVVWLLLPVWMLARMALNALDGVLAREHRQQTRLGAYANELSDVVSDAALILPLATLPSFRPMLVVWIALAASWTELAGVLGTSVGASRRHEGPMGKGDRALVLGVLGLWIGLTGTGPPLALLVQLGMLGLLGITVLRRMGHGLSEAAGGAS